MGRIKVEKESMETKIQKFYDLNEQLKKLKKDVDKLKADIKEQMDKDGTDEIKFGDLVATLSTQDRSVANEERVIQKLKLMGFDDIIKTREYIEDADVEALVYEGKAHEEDFADCLDIKVVQVFNVKKSKGGK